MAHVPVITAHTKTPSSSHARAVALFTGLVVVTLTYFVLYPSLQRIRTLSTVITETKTDLYDKQDNNYSLPKLLATYRRYESDIADMEHSVRARSRELEFITTLESLAEKNNLTQAIQIGAYEALEDFPYYRLPLKVALAGNFTDITRYLQALERLSSYVIITDLTMSNPANAQNRSSQTASEIPAGAQRVEASLTADTFWQ